MEMSNNTVKHKVLIKQYLRSILDISVIFSWCVEVTRSQKHCKNPQTTIEENAAH